MGGQRAERIDFIDTLRGIAPLLVLWAHIPVWWLAESGRSWPLANFVQKYVMSPLRLYQNGGQLGVVIFFLISGFIISHVAYKETRREFLVKRFFRIWPLMALALATMAVAKCLSITITGLAITGHPVVSSWVYLQNTLLLNWTLPTMPHALSVTWTLFPEVVFYATVCVLLPHLKSRPAATTFAILFVGMAVNLVAWNAGAKQIHSTLLCLPMFAVGRSFYIYWSKQADAPTAICIGASSLAGFAILQVVIYPESAGSLASTYLIAPILFAVCMKSNFRKRAAIKFFSDISYALYLFHMPIGVLTANLVASSGAPLGLAFPAAWISSIVVAWLATKYVGNPLYRAGSRL